MTAVLSLVVLLRISAVMTGRGAAVHFRVSRWCCAKRSATIRPIFRERGKINAEVTGPADRVAGAGCGW